MVWASGSVAVGRRLRQSLPEDCFDEGPTFARSGQLTVVGDIRLDNRQELADALSIPASLLKRSSDTALLARALEAWGEAALDRLVGDFAFVMWNEQDQSLLLARDFLGQRPLHYYRGRNFFAFASMPKGLHALPEVPRAPDHDAVAAFVALLPETGSETFFKGIEKVQPGHAVRVTRDRLRSFRWWIPAENTLILKDSGEYEEAVRASLDEAVVSCLRGAGGIVGSHLSGGLDSTAVTATAARALEGKGGVVAYTAVPRAGCSDGPPRSIANEAELASMVAKLHSNIEHVTIPSGAHSPVQRLDYYFHAFERPVLNLCNAAWGMAILDDARRRNLGVMLTGDAGNMSFSYDGLAGLSQMLREGRLVPFARLTASLVKRGTRLGTIGAQTFGPFLPVPVWRWILALRGRGSRLADYTALNSDRAVALEQLASQGSLDVSYRPRSDPRSQRLFALGRVDRGNYNKGCLGGWGVELRDPTANRRLIELCLTIPIEQFTKGGIPRSLARRAFVDRVPQQVLHERKKGYQAADWHEALTAAREEVATEIGRCVTVPGVPETLSTSRLKRLIDNWPTGGWNDTQTIESYRLALLRGTSAAHFLRKASGSNA